MLMAHPVLRRVQPEREQHAVAQADMDQAAGVRIAGRAGRTRRGRAILSVGMAVELARTDDAAILATAIRMVAGHITSEHRDAARSALKRGVETEAAE